MIFFEVPIMIENPLPVSSTTIYHLGPQNYQADIKIMITSPFPFLPRLPSGTSDQSCSIVFINTYLRRIYVVLLRRLENWKKHSCCEQNFLPLPFIFDLLTISIVHCRGHGDSKLEIKVDPTSPAGNHLIGSSHGHVSHAVTAAQACQCPMQGLNPDILRLACGISALLISFRVLAYARDIPGMYQSFEPRRYTVTWNIFGCRRLYHGYTK